MCWLHDVASVLQLRSLATGGLVKSIPLPGLGSVRSFSGRRSQSEMFYSYSDFTDPGSIYRQVAAWPVLCACEIRASMGSMHCRPPCIHWVNDSLQSIAL